MSSLIRHQEELNILPTIITFSSCDDWTDDSVHVIRSYSTVQLPCSFADSVIFILLLNGHLTVTISSSSSTEIRHC